jgi:hypothetical protein
MESWSRKKKFVMESWSRLLVVTSATSSTMMMYNDLHLLGLLLSFLGCFGFSRLGSRAHFLVNFPLISHAILRFLGMFGSTQLKFN